MHAEYVEGVEISVVIVERFHGEIKSAVLGDEVPIVREFVGFWEHFNVNGAKLVGFAVPENRGFGGVGLIAYAPSDFKAEDMVFAVRTFDNL